MKATAFVWVVLLCLWVGCSTGQSTTSCSEHSDCPGGQFCGTNGICTLDCRNDQDCPNGTCNASGQCEPTTPVPDGGIDGPKPDIGPPPDHGSHDLPPKPDLSPNVDLPLNVDLPQGDGPQPDIPPPPDLASPEAPLPDLQLLTCMQAVGKPCTSGGFECGATAVCLLTSGQKGVCSCSCTPDNPSTPINEDNCPGHPSMKCGELEVSPGVLKNYCFGICKPKLGSNDCQGGLACDPRSGGNVGLPTDGVCAYYGCSTDSDCPVITKTPCNLTSPCGTSEICFTPTPSATAGFCAKAGKCDTTSGLCDDHALGNPAAKVGDTCQADTDCANNMQCMMEIDWANHRKKAGQTCNSDSECCSEDCTGGTCAAGLCTVHYRNGYCTIAGCTFGATLTKRACPAGSHCNRLWFGGLCQKACDLSTANQCRNHGADLFGDYECRAWQSLTLNVGGVPVADGSVCDFGPAIDCAVFAGSNLDCSSLGDNFNSTNMACRGLDNSLKTNKFDPAGFCFDNTPSGALFRNPLP